MCSFRLWKNRELMEYGGDERSVVIPDTVTRIADFAFSACEKLESVTIGKNVTQIGEHCDEEIACESLNARFNHAFEDCNHLREIIVDSDNPEFSSQDGVLYNRDKTLLIFYPPARPQTTFSIPDGVEVIDEGAFERCGNLESVTIPSSVTQIGLGAFDGCTALRQIIYDGTAKQREQITIQTMKIGEHQVFSDPRTYEWRFLQS